MPHTEPDMLDLNDWATVHAPTVYNVAKYLSDTERFYNLLLLAWRNAGSPEITPER